MTIKRTVNGVEMEFELTRQEIIDICCEQQLEDDCAEINFLIDEFYDDEDSPIYGMEWTDEQIAACAKATREYLDDYEWLNESINEARQDAFREWCEKNLGVEF